MDVDAAAGADETAVGEDEADGPPGTFGLPDFSAAEEDEGDAPPGPLGLPDFSAVEGDEGEVPPGPLGLSGFVVEGSLSPFAAKASPKAVRGPPPAGLTWQRPQGKLVCRAKADVAAAGRRLTKAASPMIKAVAKPAANP
jgi:hypothetical protein